ncbi:MAG: class I SAM-dependent methyltransferase [Nitrospirota bacterium]
MNDSSGASTSKRACGMNIKLNQSDFSSWADYYWTYQYNLARDFYLPKFKRWGLQPAGLKVLDIGCGNGGFTAALEALRAAHRLLKPGGALFLGLPDFGGFPARFFRAAWFGMDAPRHMTHFKKDTLSAMLRMAGFKKPMFFPGGSRYETAMLVRSALPDLNFKKLRALEKGLSSKYFYKALQLILDLSLLPTGILLASTGRGSTFTAVAFKEQVH